MCRITSDLFREFQFGIKHFLVSSAIYVRNSVTFIVSLLVKLSTKNIIIFMPFICEINCPIRAIVHCAFILRSFPPPFRFWLFVFMVLAFSTIGLHKIKFLYSVGQESFSFVSSCLSPNIEKHDKEYKANYFA